MRPAVFLFSIIAVLLQAACSMKETHGEAMAATEEASAAATQKSTAASGQLGAAQDAVKKGEIDKAAAQLLQMQTTAANFSPGEAEQYRDVMSEAYTKALEAAQRGDPKGVAALQMIRAANQR